MAKKSTNHGLLKHFGEECKVF